MPHPTPPLPAPTPSPCALLRLRAPLTPSQLLHPHPTTPPRAGERSAYSALWDRFQRTHILPLSALLGRHATVRAHPCETDAKVGPRVHRPARRKEARRGAPCLAEAGGPRSRGQSLGSTRVAASGRGDSRAEKGPRGAFAAPRTATWLSSGHLTPHSKHLTNSPRLTSPSPLPVRRIARSSLRRCRGERPAAFRKISFKRW